MIAMAIDYTHLPEFLQLESGTDFIRLTGHRIGLAEVVRQYTQGETPEGIAVRYPTLALAHIHKVIAYYLENEVAVGEYVAADDQALREMEAAHPYRGPSMTELRRRFEAMRRSGS